MAASIKYLVDLNLNGNEIQNFALQNLSTAQQPDPSISAGLIYYDTTENAVFVSNGTDFGRVGLTADGTTITESSGTISVGTIAISNVSGLQTALNGKVDDSQVLTDVPANAVFTDEDVSTANLYDRLTQISAMVLGDGNGSITINGDFNVVGTTTTVSTANINLEDNIITLNSAATTAAADAGIEVNRGSGNTVPQILWDESASRWKFTNNGSTYYNLPVSSEYSAGDITAVVAGDGLAGGATSGSATLTNRYNTLMSEVTQGTGNYVAFPDAFAQIVPESMMVEVKELTPTGFKFVITDWEVDMNTGEVKVFLPTGGEFIITFHGIRA